MGRRIISEIRAAEARQAELIRRLAAEQQDHDHPRPRLRAIVAGLVPFTPSRRAA